MIKRITEIGIAVRDLATSGPRLHGILGAQRGTVLRSDEYDMVAQMFRTGNIEFELMQPLHPGGIIGEFLQKRGEGLHHIAFQVENIVETLTWMKKHRVKMINEQPVSVDDLKAAFLHPESCGGVLIELIEGIPKHVDNRALPSELQAQVLEEGIGVEGILEVGILVRDLETTSNIYSNIFLPDASEIVTLDQSSVRIRMLRVGNVNLKLMEITRKADPSTVLSGKCGFGLNHVILKVKSIKAAIAYLTRKGIALVRDPLSASYDSKALLIHPKELSGIPVFLRGEVDLISSSIVTDAGEIFH